MPELAAVDEIVKNKPPLRLFKYRQVNAATEQLLLDNEIYCSTPYQFNDPFECRPLVHLDVHSTETKEWLNRNMAERGITNPSKKLAIRRRMKHSYGNPRPIDDSMNKSLLTKAPSWEYEQEWRLIMRTPERSEIDRFGTRTDDLARWTKDQHGPGIYQIPKESITGVILGMRISDTDRDRVTKWIREGRLNLELRRANRNKSQFRVDIESTSPNAYR